MKLRWWAYQIAMTCGQLLVLWFFVGDQIFPGPAAPGEPQQAFFVTLLLLVATFVASELLRPQPQVENAKPAGLGDFQFPTATEGRHVPLFWGTVRVKGPNVVWYGDLRQEAIQETLRTGLFSKKTFTKGFRYKVGVQFALARGRVGAKLLRIWVGEEEVFAGSVTHGNTATIDEPDLYGGDDLGNGGFSAVLKFFEGNQTQTASSYLSSFQQEGGDTPAYRGTLYLAPNADPIYIGNGPNPKPVSFEIQSIPNYLSLTSAGAVNTTDANPANVIYEIMTDTEWGLGHAASKMDTVQMAAVGEILKAEGNGFSFYMDRQMPAEELLNLVEEQIDGAVVYDQASGKYQISLSRADYDISTVPDLSPATYLRLEKFNRMLWEDTTNQVRVEFSLPSDDYKTTYAVAVDGANVIIQGANISVSKSYPGVKNAALANQLAWRDLRVLSYPLVNLTIVADRSFHDTVRNDVFAFTNPELNIVDMPVRVVEVDLGELDNNEVRLQLVQDIFYFQAGSFGNPPGTGWDPPTDDLQPFDSDKQLAFEAPRAFVLRDPDSVGFPAKIWATARRKGVEVSYKIVERHASGTPSGSFTEVAESFGFMLIGELSGSLAAGSAYPFSSITVVPTPDGQATIEAAIEDNPPDLGTELVNLVLIDSEFILVSSASTSGANVLLTAVYRGAMDSVQGAHSSGAKVYLLSTGGNISNTSLPETDNVHVKLLPRSTSDEVLESAATQIAFTMDKRNRRPYPVASVTLNGVLFDSTSVSLEGVGSDGDTYGIGLAYVRRDYRTVDEVAALTTDAASIFGDFPSANNTLVDVEVRNDPAGANTLLYTESDLTTASQDILRKEILRATDGVLPTTMRFVVKTKHDEGADTGLYNRSNLTWDFTVVTALTGQFNFGALDTNDVSNVYTADAAGTHSFTMSSSLSGNVEYRLTAGSWTVLITSGGTTGSILGVVVSDTIELRHLAGTNGDGFATIRHIDMAAPGAGTDAYAIPFT